jgi:hypothetical protein
MGPVTTALMRAIEMALVTPAERIGTERRKLIEIDKSRGLKDGFLDAPPGTLYIELEPDAPTTRFLWAELLEVGACPPMTAITPGEGNGVAVLLSPEGIELYIMEDGPKPGQLIGQLSPEAGKPAKWTFQRG